MVQKSCDEIRNIALEFDNGIELTAYKELMDYIKVSNQVCDLNNNATNGSFTTPKVHNLED